MSTAIRHLFSRCAIAMATMALPFTSCSADPMPDQHEEQIQEQNEESSMKVNITIGGKAFTAEIEDSQTGKAFLDKLPLTLDMSELNGNEKYCYGVSLPRNDHHYGSIFPGDLMLYSGNCLVLFYGAAGGYSYTCVGKIADITGLAEAVGKGSVTVIFEQQ